jgi:hypothetical protein
LVTGETGKAPSTMKVGWRQHSVARYTALFTATHAACCTAAHGVAPLSKPSAEVITSRLNAVAVLLQREAEALALHADDDVSDARPRIKPCVKRAECRRLRRELEEAEGGDEESAAAISRDGHAIQSPDPPAAAVMVES